MAGTESQDKPANVRFSVFEVNLARRELFKHGTRLKLQGQPFEVLCALLERPGEIIPREELRRRLWPDNTFVEYEDSLNTTIRKLRSVLSDSSDAPRYIETVARRGYRFIAPILPQPPVPAVAPFDSLPSPRASVIGRDREIEDVARELRRDSVRLLTLTGVGGVGKTTLAQAAARRLLPEFPDGISLVDLAPIRQAELLASVMAQALGIKDADRSPDALKEHLRGRKLLLVLDNFEQVVGAGPLLAELLAAAPGLKLLVTSRARLQLRGEREFIVPPLAAPDTPAELSAAELAGYEAVALFVERARAVNADFALTEQNASSVARICARLEGLPLAIELAAARVKLLSPHAILARLDHRLPFLTGGARDLPTRQQTMTGAIQWSYDLLTDAEKSLFRRLAVFAGGFTLEAAEMVLADPSLLDRITSLVNQSLLVVRDSGTEPRLQMLEVVREFAADALEGSGEAESTRRQHAAHFLALAEKAAPHFQSDRPADWLSRLEEEHQNIRAALRWALAHDPATAARMAAAIRYFWIFQGYLTEGLGILKEILGATDCLAWTIRSKLLNAAGNMAKFQGDFATARAMYEEGLRQGLASRDLPQVSLFYRGLGSLVMEQQDHAAARGFIEKALAAARDSHDRFGIARSLNMLGDLARSLGDDRTARPLILKALRLCRRVGNKYATGNILINLAAAEFGLGDYSAAQLHFSEGLTMAREEGSRAAGARIAITYALDGFAALAVRRNEGETAARLAGAAEHLRQSMGFHIEAAERRFRDAYLAKLSALLPAEKFSHAFNLGRALKLEECIALALGR